MVGGASPAKQLNYEFLEYTTEFPSRLIASLKKKTLTFTIAGLYEFFDEEDNNANVSIIYDIAELHNILASISQYLRNLIERRSK